MSWRKLSGFDVPVVQILLILKPPFLGLDWSITNGIVSSKIYDKRDDFYFEICNHYDCPSFAERSDYCVTLDSSILMFHWVRPFTVVFLSFRCFVFRCFVGLPFRGYEVM